MLRLIVTLSLASLVAMTAIDRVLGPRAEFLNAWSVLERLAGRSPSAGESMVAARFGAIGELLAVVLANAAIGSILALVAVLFGRMMR